MENKLTAQECLDFIKENIETFEIQTIEPDENHPHTHEMFTIKHQHVGVNSLEECIYNAINQDNTIKDETIEIMSDELARKSAKLLIEAFREQPNGS